MVKKIFFSIICFFILSLISFAGEFNVIDKAEDACINKAVSTTDMLNCTATAYDAWDKEMNKYYNLLMQKLSAEQKSALLKTQKSWLAYRDNSFTFINDSIKEKQGTMYLNVASGERRAIVKQRALQLKEYYQIISE